eukprot:s111_g40.t1
MTERAFYKHCENVLGLTAEESEEYWKEFYADKSLQRDQGGFRGAERLWLPIHELKSKEREHYADNKVVEGSGDIKNPSLKDRQVLEDWRPGDHLKRQDLSWDNPVFAMSEEQCKLKRPPATPSKGQPASVPEETPEKTVNVNLTRERPTLHRSVETSLKKVTAEMDKAINACVSAEKAFKEYPQEMRVNDRALISFLRVMQFRREMVARCTGSVDCIVSLVPDASASTQSGVNADQSAADSAVAPSSPAQSMLTGFTAAKKELEEEDRKKVTFDVFMQEQRTTNQKFWDGHLRDVMPFEQVHTVTENILDTQEPQKFLELKKQWQSCERAYHQIAKGTKQSADDVMRHMKVRLAENTREKKRKAEQEAKAELQKVREDAKAAAEMIKKRKQTSEEKTDPLYTVDLKPEVAAQVCISETKLSKALSFWGAQYKKTMAQSKLAQVTYPVDAKMGLAEVSDFFEEIIPVADKPDISSVPGGKAFMDSAWLFGCSSDMKQTGFLPNHAALLKMLAVGEVRHVLFEWKSLEAAWRTMMKISDGQGLSTDDLLEGLMKVDEASLVILVKHGANIRQCSLAKLEVLFVPMGWLCVEIAVSSSFIYGIRKSVFVKGSASVYEGAIGRVEAPTGSSVPWVASLVVAARQPLSHTMSSDFVPIPATAAVTSPSESALAKRRRIIEGLKDQFDSPGLPYDWLPNPMCGGKRAFERRCFVARELLREALSVYGQVLKDLEARAVRSEGVSFCDTTTSCKCCECDKVTPEGLD